jgi:hypothetical protein
VGINNETQITLILDDNYHTALSYLQIIDLFM